MAKNTCWTNPKYSTEELKELAKGKLTILGAYIKGSTAKGLAVESRTIDGIFRKGSDKDMIFIIASPFGEEMAQEFIGEIKDVKGDITFKNISKLRTELLYDQNYDAVEMMFFPESSVVFEVPELTELRKNAKEFLTKRFYFSASGNAANQFQKFSNENKTMNIKREEVLKDPDPIDFVDAANPSRFSNSYIPIKEFLEKANLRLDMCKYSTININQKALDDTIKIIQEAYDKVNQENAQLRDMIEDAEYHKGLCKPSGNDFKKKIEAADRVGYLYYDFKGDPSFKDDDESFEKFKSVVMTNISIIPEEKLRTDYRTLLTKENIEKNRWGIVSKNGKSVEIRDSAATDAPEQSYPIGLIIYRRANYAVYQERWIRYYKWTDELKDKCPEWDVDKQAHRNVERHAVNVRAAAMSGSDPDKVQAYDTKQAQQSLYIQRVALESLRNGCKTLQVDRTNIDREELLAIKFQDEYNNYISKENLVEMISKNREEMDELIRKSSAPKEMSTETRERLGHIFERCFIKYSVPFDLLKEVFEERASGNIKELKGVEKEQLINEYVRED